MFEYCQKEQSYEFIIQNDYFVENFCFIPNLNTVKTVEKVIEHTIMNFKNKHKTSAL